MPEIQPSTGDKHTIGLILGDPAGIGPEVALQLPGTYRGHQ